MSHFWDTIDEKLLLVETKYNRVQDGTNPNANAGGNTDNDVDSRANMSHGGRMQVDSLYATSPLEYGLVLCDSFGMDKSQSALLAVRTPNLFFLANKQAVAFP